MPFRPIRVRYAGTCTACGSAVRASTDGWWDGTTKALRCQACGPGEIGAEAECPSVDPGAGDPPTQAAGASAQREFERRQAKRDADIRARYPRLGGLLLALSDDPQSTRAWAKGAEGERRVASGLNALAEAGVVALHDRRIPGSKGNIDHLAVAPTGVWVIDAKRYTGQVSKKDVGGWLKSDVRLFVGRRDCTKLITAMVKQVDVVRAALGDHSVDVPVHPALCFVDAEWSWFAKPFQLQGVTVAGPRGIAKMVSAHGTCTPDRIELIASHLDARLRPA